GKSLALMSFGGVTAFWSASRGVLSVQRGIRKVYKKSFEENFFKNIAVSVFYTMLLLIALLAILALMVFENLLYGVFLNILPIKPDFNEKIMLCLSLVVFFTFMYWVFVGKGTKLKDHFAGGVFTTLGWILASFIFSVYVENFANYSYIYGSLSVIVLMMLWIYILMIILLLGAEVNVFIKERILKR
ncbi:MAG: YihY/virulence factor BrkB family protein, partial [Clostridia bacterium]|nr:YihY/virulence factor BrkB family protein [Clostridia bacterium]